MLLAGILFVLSAGPTIQAWDHSGPSHINHQPRKHPTGQSGGGIFLNEVPTSQMTNLYPVDFKPVHLRADKRVILWSPQKGIG